MCEWINDGTSLIHELPFDFSLYIVLQMADKARFLRFLDVCETCYHSMHECIEWLRDYIRLDNRVKFSHDKYNRMVIRYDRKHAKVQTGSDQLANHEKGFRHIGMEHFHTDVLGWKHWRVTKHFEKCKIAIKLGDSVFATQPCVPYELKDELSEEDWREWINSLN